MWKYERLGDGAFGQELLYLAKIKDRFVKKKDYPARALGEATLGNGTLISFSCAPDNVDKVHAFLEEHVCEIELPVVHSTENVEHGGYGRYSRYMIKQHKYAAGGYPGCGGYIEVLEILNPPHGLCPFMIHEYRSYIGGCFSEWESREAAIKAFEKNWCSNNWHDKIAEIPGFKRLVECAELTPWFYAVGAEVLFGDYALTPGLEDDPVFRLGRKFVIPGENGVFTIKTCLGSRFVTEHSDDHSYPGTSVWRYVYFNDGSTMRLHKDNGADGPGLVSGSEAFPRALREEEMWITEAMSQFRALLSGMKAGFQIKFVDGRMFTARLSANGKAVPSVAGDYLISLNLPTSGKRQGWIKSFVPTTKVPDIISCVRKRFPTADNIKIIECKPASGGKRWSGVFFTSMPEGV